MIHGMRPESGEGARFRPLLITGPNANPRFNAGT